MRGECLQVWSFSWKGAAVRDSSNAQVANFKQRARPGSLPAFNVVILSTVQLSQSPILSWATPLWINISQQSQILEVHFEMKMSTKLVALFLDDLFLPSQFSSSTHWRNFFSARFGGLQTTTEVQSFKTRKHIIQVFMTLVVYCMLHMKAGWHSKLLFAQSLLWKC